MGEKRLAELITGGFEKIDPIKVLKMKGPNEKAESLIEGEHPFNLDHVKRTEELVKRMGKKKY